jgi:abhydrolase domain-containing protein 5
VLSVACTVTFAVLLERPFNSDRLIALGLTTVAPVIYALATLRVRQRGVCGGRLWRPASLLVGEAAEVRLIQRRIPGACPTVLTVEGMHTVVFECTRTSDLVEPQTMLLLHGYASGGALYLFNIEALMTRYRVVVVDWLGCALSDRPRFAARGTAEAQEFFCGALERWRVAMSIERAVVVAHSIGGYLAAVYASTHADRVVHLVLISPVGVGRLPEPPPPPAVAAPAAGAGACAVAPAAAAAAAPDTESFLTHAIVSILPIHEYREADAAVRWAWRHDITPHTVLRWAGPLGPLIVRRLLPWYFKNRMHPKSPSRAILSMPKSPGDRALLSDLCAYVYNCLASDSSGECALDRLLLPSLEAKEPMGWRLIQALKPPPHAPPTATPQMGVTIIYGSRDWMRTMDGEDSGAPVCKALRECGIDAECVIVPLAGHFVFLDNPQGTNDVILRRVSPRIASGP